MSISRLLLFFKFLQLNLLKFDTCHRTNYMFCEMWRNDRLRNLMKLLLKKSSFLLQLPISRVLMLKLQAKPPNNAGRVAAWKWSQRWDDTGIMCQFGPRASQHVQICQNYFIHFGETRLSSWWIERKHSALLIRILVRTYKVSLSKKMSAKRGGYHWFLRLWGNIDNGFMFIIEQT